MTSDLQLSVMLYWFTLVEYSALSSLPPRTTNSLSMSERETHVMLCREYFREATFSHSDVPGSTCRSSFSQYVFHVLPQPRGGPSSLPLLSQRMGDREWLTMSHASRRGAEVRLHKPDDFDWFHILYCCWEDTTGQSSCSSWCGSRLWIVRRMQAEGENTVFATDQSVHSPACSLCPMVHHWIPQQLSAICCSQWLSSRNVPRGDLCE